MKPEEALNTAEAGVATYVCRDGERVVYLGHPEECGHGE